MKPGASFGPIFGSGPAAGPQQNAPSPNPMGDRQRITTKTHTMPVCIITALAIVPAMALITAQAMAQTTVRARAARPKVLGPMGNQPPKQEPTEPVPMAPVDPAPTDTAPRVHQRGRFTAQASIPNRSRSLGKHPVDRPSVAIPPVTPRQKRPPIDRPNHHPDDPAPRLCRPNGKINRRLGPLPT